MRKHILIPIFCFAKVTAQEPYDLNPYGKGIIDKAAAEQIANEWHFPIKLTLVVRDEDGKPVADAAANVGIDSRLHMDGYNNYKGKTDASGKFTVEARGAGSSDIWITKDGFYPSHPEVKWDVQLNGDIENLKKFGFRPWNQTVDVMLKKIGKPIPMIVRIMDGGGKSYGIAPYHGRDIDWDLIEADWVAPLGKGKKSDLVLNFDGHYENTGKYASFAKMTLKLSNTNDGFIPILSITGKESQLKLPREAPDGGYNMKELEVLLQQTETTRPKRIPDPEPYGYFIRFRTEVDPDGNVISANYGKITTPIRLTPPGVDRKSISFSFSSYINPTPNDRNLEYDRHNNLAPEANKGVTLDP